MIYTDLVKLRITPKEISQLPKFNGIERIWHTYDQYKQEVICQLAGSPYNNGLDADNPVYKEDIQHALEQLSKFIVQDGVRYQKETPLKLTEINTFVDHPRFRGEYDHIRGKFKMKYEMKIPVMKIQEINKHYEKRGLGQLEDFKGVIEDPTMSEEEAPQEKFKKKVIMEMGFVETGKDVQKI